MKIRRITDVLIIMSLIIALAACGKKPEPATTSYATEETAAPAEPSEEPTGTSELSYTGILVEAQIYSITVDGSQGTLVFDITSAAFYNFTNGITLGDTVTVVYKENKGKLVASKVTIDEEASHAEHIFTGIVSDLHSDTIDVTDENCTIRFAKNSQTQIAGELSKGDQVSVVYLDYITGYPVATIITVINDNKEYSKDVCIGYLAKADEKQILVSLESSHAFYFNLTADTKITGKSDKLEVGQKVAVIYSGDADDIPDAESVEILETPKYEEHKISGVISGIEEGSLSVKVGENEYQFSVDGNTRYTGEKPAKGLKVTVTYTGTIESGARAVSIDCQAEPESPTEKPTEKPTEPPTDPPTESPTDPPTDPPTESPTDPPTESPTDPPTDPPTESPTEPPTERPVIPPIDGSGIMVEWGGTDNTCTVLIADSKEIKLQISDDIDIPAGYFPAQGDIVQFKYNMFTMSLVELRLLAHPKTLCEATVVSWDGTKCILKDIITPKDDSNGSDQGLLSGSVLLGADSNEENQFEDADEVEFIIAGNVDIDEGYTPKQGEIIKFRYIVTVLNSDPVSYDDAETPAAGEQSVYMITYVRFLSVPTN